jgi:anaerobic magnesium-protoporphyrin IX monomethyl ester cyclase
MAYKTYDCILISPFYFARSGFFKIFKNIYPHIGLGYLYSFLKEKGYSTKIIDCNIEFQQPKEFEACLKDLSATTYIKYVGFTSTTATINNAIESAKLFKKYFPDTKVIFGGPHVNYAYMEIISNECVDYIVIGEGELTLLDIVAGKVLPEIEGLIYKIEHGEIIINKKRERIKDIDILPFPDYEALKIQKYKLNNPIPVYRYPSIGIITSRGCSGNCTFCSKTIKGRIAHHSPDYTYRLFLYLHEKFHVKQIVIMNDCFSDDKEFVEEFCNIIIKSNLNIVWTCMSRINTVDANLLNLMKKAGCIFITYGVESLDNDVLKSINKNINSEQIEDILLKTRQAGIISRSSLMVGNLSDTVANLEYTLNRLKYLKTDFITVNPTTPYPGSKLFEETKSLNLINTYDWNEYDGAVKIFKHPVLTDKQLDGYINKFYFKFYFRLGTVFRILKMINSFSNLRNLLYGIWVLIYLIISNQLLILFRKVKPIQSRTLFP